MNCLITPEIVFFLFCLDSILSSPLGTLNFLNDLNTILLTKFYPETVNDCKNPEGENLNFALKLVKSGLIYFVSTVQLL